jgi:TRAP-type C4-dicarboxylate transport system substrate-binding protein
MNRREFLTTTAASAVALTGLGGATPAFAQAKLALKASDVHPAGYPTVVAVENIGKKLEAATGGRLSVQMFASMQLGGEKEAIEQAQVGASLSARSGRSSRSSTCSTCRSCSATPPMPRR